jgi:solute carrier family 13 (sodium-dependent dicarboxylate transporter), member 2/3/5
MALPISPKRLGLVIGPLVFLLILLGPAPEGLSEEGKVVLAIAAWMIVWWITEAISVYATALLPLGLMPAMGVLPLGDIAGEYMHPIVVLLLGMFLIALTIEKTGLHKKIAFALIAAFGYSPRRIVWGFMIATALISMVVLSTTAVLVMLPIALVVMNAISHSISHMGRSFTIALMLGIAYASSIGSVATLVGAPPNLIFAGTVREVFDHTVSFAEWSALGAPLSLIMIVVAGVIMTRKINDESPELRETIKQVLLLESEKAGKWTGGQITVLSVLVGVLALMFTTPYWLPSGSFINNSVIAILGGISLFIIPQSRRQGLLDWAGVEKLPFGILFLLGGGLALSLSFINSGLAEWIASSLSFIDGLPFEMVVVVMASLIMFLSNVKSNTATAAIFVPVVANMALMNGWSPLPILFAITVASSFAFLLPMGTPPNALVYERAKITTKEMFKNGVVFNVIAIGLIALFTTFISPSILPDVGR